MFVMFHQITIIDGTSKMMYDGTSPIHHFSFFVTHTVANAQNATRSSLTIARDILREYKIRIWTWFSIQWEKNICRE